LAVGEKETTEGKDRIPKPKNQRPIHTWRAYSHNTQTNTLLFKVYRIFLILVKCFWENLSKK
jgi:hypothetical protein